MHEEAERLLRFWLGPVRADGQISADRMHLWFGGDAETDRELRMRFGAFHVEAMRGDLDHLAETPRGRLALVLAFDQLSRNIHRATPEAYAADARALALTREAVAAGVDRNLSPVERAFLYMPLMHAEDTDAQHLSVECFRALEASVPEENRDAYARFTDAAQRHRDVVERFGRFPHRNAILDRESTEAEREFLAGPGAPF